MSQPIDIANRICEEVQRECGIEVWIQAGYDAGDLFREKIAAELEAARRRIAELEAENERLKAFANACFANTECDGGEPHGFCVTCAAETALTGTAGRSGEC